MILTLIRIVGTFAGVVLMILSSGLLYETEEGLVQNRIEALWVKLSDAQSVALSKQARFTQAIAILTSQIFDMVFGATLVSLQSVTVSTCLSMVSLGVICLPGAFDLLPDEVQIFYVPVVLLFLVAGLLPVILRRKLPRRLWLASVVVLCIVAFVGMHRAGWFAGPLVRLGPVAEVAYDLGFLLLTITCDTLFVISTRWLLRKGSSLHSAARILGVTLGNCALALVLVLLPFVVALGGTGVMNLWKAEGRVSIVEFYAESSAPRNLFLMTLAGSNVFDAVVASVFFGLFLIMLLHLMLWPMLQRPVYGLAIEVSCDIASCFFFWVSPYLVRVFFLEHPPRSDWESWSEGSSSC
jgi:hypothetical protein